MKKTLIAILGLVLGLASLNAEILKDSVNMQELTVLANKPVPPTALTSAPVITVSQKDLEDQGSYNLLPALSAYVPGLYITERGIAGFGVAQGAAGGLTLRGVGNGTSNPGDPLTQVLFLINGQPQIMGLMGHPISDILSSDQVQRVDVVRGPASVLYGPNAMAGAINIITREPAAESVKASLGVQYGSYNTQNYTAHAMMLKDRITVIASGARQTTDGYLPNSQYENNSGSLSLGYRISNTLNLKASAELDHFISSNPDTVDYPKWVDVNRGMASVTLENNYERLKGFLMVFKNFGEHNIADGFHSTDQSSGVKLYQSIFLPKGIISGGLDYLHMGGFAENNSLPAPVQGFLGFPLNKFMDEGSAYLLARHEFLVPELEVNAGIRYTYNTVYGGKFLPQAGLSWEAARDTRVKASISKGYRGPTIRELYLFPPHNDTLKAEDVLDYEISWEQNWMSGRLHTELTAFYMEGSNLIRQTGPKLMNTGAFRHSGIEALATYKICSFASLTANYSYLNMETPVPSSPVGQLYAALNLTPVKKLNVNVGMQQVSDLFLSANVKESYTLVNLNARYRLKPCVELNVSGNNLLNQEYHTLINYPMPPANFRMGVKFFLDKNL